MTSESIATINDLVQHFNNCGSASHDLSLTAVALNDLGMQSAYVDLSSSPFESGRCMEDTVSSLWFMGHTGSKWRRHPGWRPFLERLSRYNGQVRFLLSEDVSLDMIRELQDLEQAFACFKARIYMSRPLFRLVVQDSQVVALQHYEGLDRVPIGDRGNAPLMTLKARGEESLFRTLVVYYSSLWSDATPVDQL